MSMFDELKKKAEELVAEHPETVEKISDQVIEQAGHAADSATHGRYTDTIKSVEEKADGAVGE